MLVRRVAPVLLLLALPNLVARAEAGARIAIFPIEFINTSLEPTWEDERRRLDALNRQLRAELEARGYSIVDTAPVAAKVAF